MLCHQVRIRHCSPALAAPRPSGRTRKWVLSLVWMALSLCAALWLTPAHARPVNPTDSGSFDVAARAASSDGEVDVKEMHVNWKVEALLGDLMVTGDFRWEPGTQVRLAGQTCRWDELQPKDQAQLQVADLDIEADLTKGGSRVTRVFLKLIPTLDTPTGKDRHFAETPYLKDFFPDLPDRTAQIEAITPPYAIANGRLVKVTFHTNLVKCPSTAPVVAPAAAVVPSSGAAPAIVARETVHMLANEPMPTAAMATPSPNTDGSRDSAQDRDTAATANRSTTQDSTSPPKTDAPWRSHEEIQDEMHQKSLASSKEWDDRQRANDQQRIANEELGTKLGTQLAAVGNSGKGGEAAIIVLGVLAYGAGIAYCLGYASGDSRTVCSTALIAPLTALVGLGALAQTRSADDSTRPITWLGGGKHPLSAENWNAIAFRSGVGLGYLGVRAETTLQAGPVRFVYTGGYRYGGDERVLADGKIGRTERKSIDTAEQAVGIGLQLWGPGLISPWIDARYVDSTKRALTGSKSLHVVVGNTHQFVGSKTRPGFFVEEQVVTSGLADGITFQLSLGMSYNITWSES